MTVTVMTIAATRRRAKMTPAATAPEVPPLLPPVEVVMPLVEVVVPPLLAVPVLPPIVSAVREVQVVDEVSASECYHQ